MTALSMTRGNSAIFDTSVHYLSSSGLTGYSAWFTAKRDAADPDSAAVFQKTLAGGGISAGSPSADSGPYAGYYVATLSTTVLPADTESLPAGYATVLVYDVKVKDGSDSGATVDSGTLTVAADVTQAV